MAQSGLGVALIKKDFHYYSEKDIPCEPDIKVPKLDNGERKKQRGQNKSRYYKHKRNQPIVPQLCKLFVDVREGDEFPTCSNQSCRDIHDIKSYLLSKPSDLGEQCYVFETHGYCPRGVTCRFGSKHITEEGKNRVRGDNFKPLSNISLLKKEVQIRLRKKTYDFEKANNVVGQVLKEVNTENVVLEVSSYKDAIYENAKYSSECHSEFSECTLTNEPKSAVEEGDCLSEKNNQREKKKIDWRGKLYLAPLTTLGNLPFRRICKEWGADITCGEMAMSTQILQGAVQEWALLKRHESEDLFGVQICGNNPHVLTRCAQLIEETADVDFIDLNLGCPIELIYQKGGGSGLLRREKQLSAVVNSIARTLTIPLTVKTRSGIYSDKLVAHKHMPLYTKADVSLITVHGRTREQRYTRTADWDYIDHCAFSAAPTPVFGSGDILSHTDYDHVMSRYPHISGVMIGRGALYKPWIFTEIKEQRDWDISSSERLDILKKYACYGFEHWGSDTKGIETTRRFLLEWLSFLYRYIPVGLLERLPQKINERPPRYVGRNDLETLMASPDSADWVKISEMICGPVPKDFQFFPKHKANAWTKE